MSIELKASAAQAALLATLVLLALTPVTATAPAAEAASCSNAQLREESQNNPVTGQPYDGGLPECRAYEMVSPSEKGGSDIKLEGAIPVAADGGAAEFVSQNAFADAENEVTGPFGFAVNHYVARRTPAGWGTLSATPPRSVIAPSTIPKDASPLDFASVASCGLAETVNNANAGSTAACTLRVMGDPWVSSPRYPSVTGGLYGDSTGNAGMVYEGGSSDLSHLVFLADERNGALLPAARPSEEDGGAELYDISGLNESQPQLSLINLNNEDEEIGPEHSTRLGGINLEPGEPCRKGPSSQHGDRYHAVSETGTIIYFTTCPSGTGGVDTVYARIGESSTVAISNPSPSQCSTCSANPAPATFEGASADGSKAFFLTTQQLVDGDTDSTPDLYEYNLSAPTGENLIQLSRGASGDPTPGVGAEVQGVVASSSDGSHVYFVARGILTTTPNATGEAAKAGADNLYVSDTDTGDTRFLAKLCSNANASGTAGDAACPASLNAHEPTEGEPTNDWALWDESGSQVPQGAQTTADGRYLVFTTFARLIATGPEADTDEAQDVYRYDYETGQLARVSVGESSDPATNNGNTPAMNATVPALGEGEDQATADIDDRGRAISEDGATIVFATPEPLGADDENTGSDPSCLGTNATGCDVYEWHEGNVSMVSDGHTANSTDTDKGHASISASGTDIFFLTRTPLVGQDNDELIDLYDSRVDGGFPAPTPEQSCAGEGCQEAPSTLPSLAPVATSGTSGGENLTPGPPIFPQASVKAAKTAKLAVTKHSGNGSTITLSLRTTGKGTLAISGAGVKPLKKVLAKAGNYKLKLTLTAKEVKALKHSKRRMKLTLRFKASSSASSVTTIKLTLKRT